MRNVTSKAILDEGRVRLTISEYTLLIEELPRKPCKRRLRSLEINTHWAVQSARRDDFIPANIFQAIRLDFSDVYETIYALVTNEIARLLDEPANAEVKRCHGVSYRTREQSYLAVAPEGVEPIEVKLADTTLRCGWTKFECWSPRSTMSHPGDGEPCYSMIEQRSDGAARKLYQLVAKESMRKALAQESWSSIWDWLRERGVAFEVRHSTW